MNTTLLVSALGAALLDFLWQGLLVGGVAAVALALLRNARPQARYLVGCIALALCLLLPVATFVRALGPAPAAAAAKPAATSTVVTDIGRLTVAGEVPTSAAFAAPVTTAAPGRWQRWRQSLQPQLPLLVTLWSLVAALLAVRMACGLAWVATIDGARSRSHLYWQAQLDALAERMALPRKVLLRVVDGLDTPAAARVWRPVVLLPASLVARMPPDLLEALLAHELAHIRRHDYLVNLLQSLVEALLFYHPVVWWLSRRIRAEREQIADDLAAQAIGDPRRLARALAELARCDTPVPTPSLALAAAGGTLMSRIQRLLRPRRQALDWKLVVPVLGMSIVCVAAFAQPQSTAAPGGIVSAIATDDRRDAGGDDSYVVDGRPATREQAARAAAEAERAAILARADAARAGERAGREAARAGALAERDATLAGERAARDAERAGERAEAEAERAGALAEHDAARAAERAARDAERDAALAEREAERAGARAAREAELAGALAWAEAERSGTLARADAERSAARAERDAERAAAEAERDAARAERDARRDAERDARDDSLETQGSIRIGGRPGGDGDYAVVGRERGTRMQVSASLDDLRNLDGLRARVGSDFLWTRRDGQAYVLTDPALIAQVRRAWAPTEPVSREMEALGEQMERHGKVMEEIGARMEAQADVGNADAEAMEALGEQMSTLGDQQGALGGQLARLSHEAAYADDEQARLAAERRLRAVEAEMETLEAKMDALGEQMEAHGEALDRAHAPLEALGEEMERAGQPMEALGDQMEVLGEKMEALSDAADAQTRAVIEQAAREGKLVPVTSLAAR